MRPKQILEAAFEEFVEKGFMATRVEDIAARVGVTKGTVYVYFATKEELFEAVVQELSTPFSALLPIVDGLTGSCTERISRLLKFLYEMIIGDRHAMHLFRFIVSEAPRFPDIMDRHHQQFVQPLVDRLQTIVDEGVASGEFGASPATKMVEVIGGPAIMICFWRLVFQDRRPLDVAFFAEAHIDLVVRALTAGAPRPDDTKTA